LMNFLKQSRDNISHKAYWKALESTDPRPVNGLLRHNLLSWMMATQGSLCYPLSQQTLHLSISLFDRFFSVVTKGGATVPKMSLLERSIHAIASSCMYLASKLEDERPIEIPDCIRHNFVDTLTIKYQATPKPVTQHDVLQWELSILRVLDFNVNVPTALDFLFIFLQSDSRLRKAEVVGGSSASKHESYEACAIYLSELTLMFPEALQMSSHVIAAVSLCCAITYIDGKPRKITNLPPKVLNLLEEERASGALKDAAAKVATILDVHSEGRDGDNGKQADEKHAESSAFFLDTYRKWKSRHTSS